MTSSTDVVVHGFETSNNMKVRVALGYKSIPYTFRTIEPADRDEVFRISGQYLTPVLVHGDRVVFDSAAILRYLDFAFRETPRLFGGSHREQWEIEDWELFARTALANPMMEIVHKRVYGGGVDDALIGRCTTAFGEAATKLADRLQGREWLVGDRMTAADITAAAVLFRVRAAELFGGAAAAVAPLTAWTDRVMAFDNKCRR